MKPRSKGVWRKEGWDCGEKRGRGGKEKEELLEQRRGKSL